MIFSDLIKKSKQIDENRDSLIQFSVLIFRNRQTDEPNQ